jgi:hypothetical protein
MENFDEEKIIHGKYNFFLFYKYYFMRGKLSKTWSIQENYKSYKADYGRTVCCTKHFCFLNMNLSLLFNILFSEKRLLNVPIVIWYHNYLKKKKKKNSEWKLNQLAHVQGAIRGIN